MIKAIFVFSLVVPMLLNAQQAILSSGGNVSGSGGSASISVGQVAYQTVTSPDLSVSQGVQQPYEIYEILTDKNISLECSVYPNPASDFLILKIPDPLNGIIYQIYDVNGVMLKNGIVTNTETAISMQNFSQGTYFINITESHPVSQDIKMQKFKIIKN